MILLDAAISDRTIPRTIQQYSRVNGEGNPTDNPTPHEITFNIPSGAKFRSEYLTNDFIKGLYNLTQFDMVALNDVILPALRDPSFDYKSETLERILDRFRPLLSTPRKGDE